MTNLRCTHPGCGEPIEVPSHFTGALLDMLSKAAVCPEHTPEEPAAVSSAPAPTVMSTWSRRVPAAIRSVYGHAPTLSDLPDRVTGLHELRQIAAAWPGRWTPTEGRDPVGAVVFSGTTGTLKTTTAYALALDIVQRMDRPDLHHTKVHIASEGDLLGDTFNERGFATPAAPHKSVRGADVVVVDDVGYGVFNSAKNRTNAWWSLMEEVSTRGKFLILTTNLGGERELWEHLGAAAFSRLVGMWGQTLPGGFRPPTSNRPGDSGYWPTPIGFEITPVLEDYRILDTRSHA